MKRVEWWVAKVYQPEAGKNPIDLWEQFKSEKAARDYVIKDARLSVTPFCVVKVTYETRKVPT